MQELLTVIATWLSINFGLPPVYDHPRVEFVQESRMAEIRRNRLASSGGVATGAEQVDAAGQPVHAIYDDLGKTIYLPLDWDAGSPADVSLLVHELVHHLQNVGGSEHDCPEARERPAYQAQARWLELVGMNLAEEFDIDAMTILVRTSCMR